MKKMLLLLIVPAILCLLMSCDTPTQGDASESDSATVEESVTPVGSDPADGTETPAEEPTEETTEDPTGETIENSSEGEAPMPATAKEALLTYTDVSSITILTYEEKLETVPVERVMAAIEYIETASDLLGVVNEGGYYLEGGDYKLYLRRKILLPFDSADGEGEWQVLSKLLLDFSPS